jgi:hypothetical protein
MTPAPCTGQKNTLLRQWADKNRSMWLCPKSQDTVRQLQSLGPMGSAEIARGRLGLGNFFHAKVTVTKDGKDRDILRL